MTCEICNHPRRKEIESAILASNYGANTESLDDIAKRFNVDVTTLRVHAMMHTAIVHLEDNDVGQSIAGEVKRHEAEVLSAVAEEYFVTLKTTGKQIRDTMNNDSLGGARAITKQLVDLYLGTGSNLRQTIESLVDMNQKVNGDQDNGIKALADVVAAIRGSTPNHD